MYLYYSLLCQSLLFIFCELLPNQNTMKNGYNEHITNTRLQLDDNFVENMARVAKFEASVDDIRQAH